MKDEIQKYKDFLKMNRFEKIYDFIRDDYKYEFFCNEKGLFISLEMTKDLDYGYLQIKSLVRDWRIIENIDQGFGLNHGIDGFVLTSSDGIAHTVISSFGLIMNDKNFPGFQEMITSCNELIKGKGIYVVDELSYFFKNEKYSDIISIPYLENLENRNEWTAVRSNRNIGLIRDYDAVGWDSPPLSVQNRYSYWYQQCFVNWEDPINIKNSSKSFRKEEGLSFDLWLWRVIPDVEQANRAWEFFKDKSLEEKKVLMNTIYPNGQTFAHVFFEKCSDFLIDDLNKHQEHYEEQIRNMISALGFSEIKLDSPDFCLVEKMKDGRWKDNRRISYFFSDTVWKMLRDFRITLKIPENCTVENFQEKVQNKFYDGKDSKVPELEMNEQMKYVHFLESDFMERHLQSKISPSQIINRTLPQPRF